MMDYKYDAIRNLKSAYYMFQACYTEKLTHIHVNIVMLRTCY